MRSFADFNGDGVGDLPGLIGKLDYFEWLGVDALWLSPINPSPNKDYGYDVSDYLDVDPALGTMADLDRLIEDAGRRGIRVLLDIVPNHTSDQHPWFSDPEKRDWYVWADRPNNWVSAFGGPAWTQKDGRWYLHNFAPGQPDLNWWNDEVRAEFERILRFWFDRGVAGFRIDVAHGLVKDELLRDNPPATRDDPPPIRRFGQRQVYNSRRPEVHDVFRRWRSIAEEYDPPRVLLGETWVLELADWAAFYGADDELQLAFNFLMATATLDATELRTVVETSLAALPAGAKPVWHGSNHDVSRMATRWCKGDEGKVRLALTMLLTLPGATVLYQGDEIGQEDGVVPPERVLDISGRDPERTPMPWNGEPKGGFTSGESWLPMGEHRRRNVAAQREDPGSVLNLTRELIALKKRLRGPYEPLPASKGGWRYRRDGVVVDLDFNGPRARIEEA
ncbi:MAG: alpha-amylase family glycosyl hydrolase [Candidatus Dormibacteraeota bacterium]|nr:alpha-amylase family glycosyl hydrolase [Candidatus Dormibacteraeota bacterium]